MFIHVCTGNLRSCINRTNTMFARASSKDGNSSHLLAALHGKGLVRSKRILRDIAHLVLTCCNRLSEEAAMTDHLENGPAERDSLRARLRNHYLTRRPRCMRWPASTGSISTSRLSVQSTRRSCGQSVCGAAGMSSMVARGPGPSPCRDPRSNPEEPTMKGLESRATGSEGAGVIMHRNADGYGWLP